MQLPAVSAAADRFDLGRTKKWSCVNAQAAKATRPIAADFRPPERRDFA
jgi:hypothetical protein